MRVAISKAFSLVGLTLGLLLFVSTDAEACCTSVLCPFAVSSSSGCVGGPDMPVCNTFGCNCNDQCGMYTVTTNGTCVFTPECDSDDALAQARERFDKVDTNHDDAISVAEVVSWIEGQKDFLKNVNRKNLPASLQGDNVTVRDFARHVFTLADKDHDGKIAPGEFDETLSRKRMTKK